MSISSALAIYFVIWWTTLFAVLPFRVRSQAEAGVISPGTDPGAPVSFSWGRIALINSAVAGAVFVLFYWLVLPLV